MIQALGLFAFCLAWLLPGHYFPWYAFQQEVAAAIGASLIVLAALVATGRRPLHVGVVAAGAALLALVPLAQWALGRMPFLADALLPAAYLLGFALTVIAARVLADGKGERLMMLFVAFVVLAAVVSTTIALGQWLRLGWLAFVEQLEPGSRVSANLLQANNLACLLGLALIGVWWLYESRRLDALGASALASFLGLGVALTQSRASWAAAVCVGVWWLIARRRVALRMGWGGIVSSVVVFTAFAMLLPAVSAALEGLDSTDVVERFQSMGTRRVHWPALWDAAWRQPFFGWGWMQVGAAQQAVALDHPPSGEWITYSHNAVLDLMVWMGALPGLLVALAIAGWIVRRARACDDATTWAALAMVAVLGVHSLLEFPYAYTYFLFPLAVVVGIIESRSTATSGPRIVLPRAGLAAAGLGMTALLAWIGVEYVEVEDMAQRARFKEAAYVSPTGQAPRPPDVVLLDSQREFIRFRLTSARPGMTTAELGNIELISRRFMPPAVMLRYALAMGLNGRPEDARRSLRLICHMWPPIRCEEGRASWSAAQATYPQLMSISFPETSAGR